MERRSARKNILITLLVAWVFAVIATYYVVHKPFTVSNLLALSRALKGLAGAGAITALGTGIGLVLLSRVGLAPVERLVEAAAIGLGGVSLAGLALGAAGLLRPWLFWTLSLIGLAATARPLWLAVQDVWTDSSWRPQGRFGELLAAYCGLTLAIALVWALTPPTAWDGLVYHLTGPQLYLAAGRISHPIDLPYLGFPQLTEVLFTWTIGMTGERAAAPIHWFYAVLTVLALVAAGRRWLGGESGWLAAAMLLSARTIVLLAGWPYVDLALLLYTTLAFFALVHWTEGRGRRWLGVTGVLAGLALSTKYTGLALLPALVVALLILRIRNGHLAIRNWRPAIRDSLLLCVIALLVWLPWLAKNLLLTGNPTYPFFFGGIHWDDWRGWWYDRSGTGWAYTAPSRLLTAPWDATIWGVQGGAGYSATVGPLFLTLLPLLLLVWPRLSPARRRWLRAAAGFCGVLYGFWLWGVARTALLRQTRLLFSAFGLLALMAGAAVEGLRLLQAPPIDLGWLTRAILLTVLALALVGTLLLTAREQPLQVLLGFESEEGFLTRRLGWHYATVSHISRELPSESVILFLWEPRSYYCSIDCRPDALLDRWLHVIHVYGHDAQAIADAWRAEGVTHVLLYQRGYKTVVEANFDPVTKADRAVLAQLLTEQMVLEEDFGGIYELYAFTGAGQP